MVGQQVLGARPRIRYAAAPDPRVEQRAQAAQELRDSRRLVYGFLGSVLASACALLLAIREQSDALATIGILIALGIALRLGAESALAFLEARLGRDEARRLIKSKWTQINEEAARSPRSELGQAIYVGSAVLEDPVGVARRVTVLLAVLGGFVMVYVPLVLLAALGLKLLTLLCLA